MALSSFRYHDYFSMLTIEKMWGKQLMLEDQPCGTIKVELPFYCGALVEPIVWGIILHMPWTIIGIVYITLKPNEATYFCYWQSPIMFAAGQWLNKYSSAFGYEVIFIWKIYGKVFPTMSQCTNHRNIANNLFLTTEDLFYRQKKYWVSVPYYH